MRTIGAWVWERTPPKVVETHIPEMESTMINLKVLSTAAAIALALPMVASGVSAVQAQDSGRGGAAAVGGGARAGGGGGGAAIGGGGGFRGGGGGAVAPGGGGGFRGGGMAAAPGGGAGFRAGGAAVAPGGDRGFRVGGAAVAPSGDRGFRSVAGVGGGPVAGGRYYGGGYRHHHRGGGFWPGFAIGAGVGSAYGYYDNSPYYYDDSAGYYDDSVVAEAPPAGDDSVAYCMQRYKSYDAASGTYLGFDGQRHPCPAQ
jgi:hypothetical protein